MISVSKTYTLSGVNLGVLECVCTDLWQYLTDYGKAYGLNQRETSLLADVAIANRIIADTAAQE